MVRSVGVREKYGYYKKGIKYGKSHNLQEVQKEKVEDMVKEATGKPIPLDENSHAHILQYVQTLAPQKRVELCMLMLLNLCPQCQLYMK